MPEENEEEPAEEEKPKKEGQVLGCLFALFAVALIFGALFLFLRACA